MIDPPEAALPKNLRARARLSGNEWAWAVSDIPALIDAGRAAGLLNVGGQLQFRFPEATCELNWIEVDTSEAAQSDLPWRKRVERTAAAALTQFRALCDRYDFLSEGQTVFGRQIDAYRAKGGDPLDAMCFVWYFEAFRD
jgi:hypothetical protein